jgi:plasmid stability protein
VASRRCRQSADSRQPRVGVLVAVVLATVLCAPRLGASDPSGRIVDLLNRYDGGDYQGLLAELDGPNGREKLWSAYSDTAAFWIRAGHAELIWRRTLVAASLALDLARDLKRVPTEPWHGAPLILWACDQLRRQEPPTPVPAERWWYLASIAELEAHDGWPLLIGRKDALGLALSLSLDNSLQQLAQRQDEAGHIGHAQARFPDEPRFALAAIEAREQLTAFLAAPIVPATSTLAQDVIRPSDMAELQRIASIKVPFSPQSADGRQALLDRAVAHLAITRASLVPDVARGFAALTRADQIRGEAELHFGYLEARLQAWPDARTHLDQVHTWTDDPQLLSLTDYFDGWIAQNLGDHASVVEANRRALSRTPGVQWASWPLAAELLMTGRSDARSEARAILNAALASRDDSEPLLTYYAGDAWRLDDYLDRLRRALR